MLALLRRSWLCCLAVLVTMTGCLPYTVGHTAKPAPKKQVNVTTSLFGMDKRKDVYNAVRVREAGNDTMVEARIAGWNYVGVDLEARLGLNDRSDLGIRLASGQGVLFTYMRKLNGTTETLGANISVLVGGGIVSFPNFGVGEVSLLASGDERGDFTPYGGVRVVQTFPLGSRPPQDDITIGGFFGSRFGGAAGGISPEIGVYYDKPYPGLVKRGNLLVVSSISVHGNPFPFLQRLLTKLR